MGQDYLVEIRREAPAQHSTPCLAQLAMRALPAGRRSRAAGGQQGRGHFSECERDLFLPGLAHAGSGGQEGASKGPGWDRSLRLCLAPQKSAP